MGKYMGPLGSWRFCFLVLDVGHSYVSDIDIAPNFPLYI